MEVSVAREMGCSSSEDDKSTFSGVLKPNEYILADGSRKIEADLNVVAQEKPAIVEITVLKGTGPSDSHYIVLTMDSHTYKSPPAAGKKPEWNSACRFFLHPSTNYNIEVALYDKDLLTAEQVQRLVEFLINKLMHESPYIQYIIYNIIYNIMCYDIFSLCNVRD